MKSVIVRQANKSIVVKSKFTLNIGFTGVGEVSPLATAVGTGDVAGSSCFTLIVGGGSRSGAEPSFADRFLLRGSVDFEPASSASINSELSCSNAVVIKE